MQAIQLLAFALANYIHRKVSDLALLPLDRRLFSSFSSLWDGVEKRLEFA